MWAQTINLLDAAPFGVLKTLSERLLNHYTSTDEKNGNSFPSPIISYNMHFNHLLGVQMHTK